MDALENCLISDSDVDLCVFAVFLSDAFSTFLPQSCNSNMLFFCFFFTLGGQPGMLNLQQWGGSETSSHGSISTGKPLPSGTKQFSNSSLHTYCTASIGLLTDTDVCRCRLCRAVVCTTNFFPLKRQLGCTISNFTDLTFNLIKIIQITKLWL